MDDLESVTHWLSQLKNKKGDDCVEQLWSKYIHRQEGLARKLLAGSPGANHNAEDVAISAFKSFCIRAREGKFPDVNDRDDLWRVLATITARKAYRLGKRERQRSDKQQVAFDNKPKNQDNAPDSNSISREELGKLFEILEDADLRIVAYCKLEGLTNQRIATSLDVSVPTIERKLRLIRTIWEREQVR